MLKLLNCEISVIIDNVLITGLYKFETNINYSDSIFIDDNPRDLIGLCNNNAKKVIRIKRKNTKYSNCKLDNKDILTYNSLNAIDLNILD